jgi:ribonuclease Z
MLIEKCNKVLLSMALLFSVFAAPCFSQARLDTNEGLSVILLGTGVPIPNPARATACTAVLVDHKVFLVDTGRNCVVPLNQAGIQDVEGIFYTHYHSDHFIGLGEILLDLSIDGIDKTIVVRGPVGAKEIVDGIVATYRLDLSYRLSHHGDKFSSQVMKPLVTEYEPGVVLEKDGLKVSMFSVCHPPIEPAVGYRFEYKGEVVAISGDSLVCPELAAGVSGADILVAEAENAQMLAPALGMAKQNGDTRRLEMIEEGMEYHAETLALAQMAQDNGVKKLALTHLFPSIPPTDAAEALFVQGMSELYKGPILVGRDGMRVDP